MNGDLLKNCNDEINVEEIMAKIRGNIQRRKVFGHLLTDPDSIMEFPSNNSNSSESDDVMKRDVSYIKSNWNIHNNSYAINSHHPFLGKFLVQGRQMVNGEVRRYVDPMISCQTEFNAKTVRIITQILQRNSDLEQRQKNLELELSSFRQESNKRKFVSKENV